MPPQRRAFLEGLRDVLPMLLGAGPFGLITGVSAVGAGMHPFDIVLMSGLVFAGASQLAAISLMASGAAVWAILLTVAMVNLRHVMYSLALAPWLQRYGVLSRLLVSFLMVDHSFAVAILKYPRAGDDYPRVAYAVGIGVPMWLTWVATTAAGAVLGAQLPAEWQLDFAVPLLFLALLVPAVTTRPLLVAAVVAGALALALAGLPYNLGLVVGSLAGIAAGAASESLTARQGRRVGA
ncbi:MAG TPA: AzlC family ABC transporter permease [Trueperaceae bacterium]|mgnify:FL=1|nr:AzlC family ABC transporter permease [Trueperaceae bacterium]